MFGICVESSNLRGMGHFFRGLVIRDYLIKQGEECLIVINNDEVSVRLLKKRNIRYAIADYSDETSDWEGLLTEKFHIGIWILDKFETSVAMARHMKNHGALLVTIDDVGEGSELADVCFGGLLLKNLRGRHIYQGNDYIVLNPEISLYRRKRTELKRILVTLGGSDTYGVTNIVVNILKNFGYTADVVIGPNFNLKKELADVADSRFTIYDTVPSLIKFMYGYDFVIAGGGVTCVEANASGLPCLIIANEPHEIDTGIYVEKFGGARFAGYYRKMRKSAFQLKSLPISEMSDKAMQTFHLNGMENIYRVIKAHENAG